jgi:hypothetical protein
LVRASNSLLVSSVSTGGFRDDSELEEITTVSDGGASSEGVLLLGNSISVSLLLVLTSLLRDSVSGVVVVSSPGDLDAVDSAHSTSEVGDGSSNDTTNARNVEGVLSSSGGNRITVKLESINLELVRSVNVVKLEGA